MSNLQHILQQLFRKESLEEIPVEQLEIIVNEHPLFAPAHFLLAKKYKQIGNELYKKQIQKTALHFHNPLWLHYHIAQTDTTDPVFEDRSFTSVTAASPAAESTGSSHDLMEEVVVHQELQPTITEQPFANPSEASVDLQVKTDAPVGATDDAHIGEMYTTNADSEALKLEESSAAMHHEKQSGEQTFTTDSEALKTDESQSFKNSVTGDELQTHSRSSPAEELRPIQPHPIFSKSDDQENGESKPAFEPFHTVDYFASQGIKVSPEFKPEDRLGKQLKSFTEWLRTMRKLPEASVEAELEKINDREIVSIAEHSLDENEVVTEAMAEVLFKQGRHEQAAEVYRKLSLINPAKSSYFAAKIEALKNH